MDESANLIDIVRSYGGSDVAAPSFNRMRYTRHGSVHEPLDLGAVERLNTVIEGNIGAESGTQTLFFSFETLCPSRIGLRLIHLQPYTDQYISIGLSGENGLIPLGIDGFAGSTIDEFLEVVTSADVVLDLGYATCGYFVPRVEALYPDIAPYTELDCSSLTIPGVSVGEVFDPDENFDSPYGAKLPEGRYGFTVSSSQWPQLPYCIQVAVVPAGELEGVALGQSLPTGRLSQGSIAAVATMQSLANGLVSTGAKLVGVATLESRSTGTLTRTSPYGL